MNMQEAYKFFSDCFGAFTLVDFSFRKGEAENSADKDLTGRFIDGNVISKNEWQH